MAFLLLNTLAPVLMLLFFLLPQAIAQTMSPDPVFDCTNPNFRVIYTACSANDFSRCCAVGTSCCAGGCCDLLSNCLNVSTSNEVCCPATDPTLCGFSSGSGTTPPYAVQSVACTGSDGLSSYYCPPGATCNSAEDSCIGGPGGGSGGVGVVPSVTTVASTAAVLRPSSSADSYSAPEPSTVTVEQTSKNGGLELTLTSSSPSDTSAANQATTFTVTSNPSGQKGAASRNNVTRTGVYVFGVSVFIRLFFF